MKTLKQQRDLHNENFKANIVSKSRIEWIQEVRKKSAEFIASCYDLFELMESLEDLKNLSEERKKEVFELRNEVQKNGTLLILYFGPDSSKNNDLIALIVRDLSDLLTNKNLWDAREDLYTDRIVIDVLKDFLRIYFKAEWKRANGEIEDSEVQSYLEKDELYRRIKSIFKNRVELSEEFNDEYYQYIEGKYGMKSLD